MFSSRSSRVARGGLVAALAFSIAGGVAPSGAFAADDEPLIYYPTFAGASKTLERNGSADILTSSGRLHQRILRLTAGGYRQVGSAWSRTKLDLDESFESEFKVYLHHFKPGADGIAFLVQDDGPRALGGWGGGLGYRGIKHSVAIPVSVPEGMRWQLVKRELTVDTPPTTTATSKSSETADVKQANRVQPATEPAPRDEGGAADEDFEMSLGRVDSAPAPTVSPGANETRVDAETISLSGGMLAERRTMSVVRSRRAAS